MIAPFALGQKANVKKFIDNHKRIRRRLDTAGKRGMCETKDELIKAAPMVSPAEWELHKKVFEMHNYFVPALPDTYCNRDGLRELAQRLTTAKK